MNKYVWAWASVALVMLLTHLVMRGVGYLIRRRRHRIENARWIENWQRLNSRRD